jgi:UDP-GlcNAc:undecaprenyl-phosphate GlcNAc-1-phosphate transferase
MFYFLYFLLTIALSFLLTNFFIFFAKKIKIYDLPNLSRKIHSLPIPLLGGFAIFFTFAFVLIWYLKTGEISYQLVPKKFFISILSAGAVLMLGGFLDDKYNLPPKFLWLFPALASLLIVWSGIGVGIKHISNPFGAPISIDYNLFVFPLSGVVMWIYLMGMIFTTKFLDGLDGLCAGISLIGGITLFSLSLLPHINQPITASLAIIFSGSILGFLLFNFHPAKIFLGESGSTFCGFMLGVLSIILGGKIATVLLVMGIPILDVAWAIIRRLFYSQSPFKGDRTHLHHRLLDIGLSQRQTVGFLWAISAVFGAIAVFLQSLGKLIALGLLFALMLGLAITVVAIYKRKHPHIPDLFESTPVDQKSKK